MLALATSMSMRSSEAISTDLTVRQKLIMFHGTGLSAEAVLSLKDSQITADMVANERVRSVNVSAAGISPSKLKAMGFATAKSLKTFGFDALSLCDKKFAVAMNAEFGAEHVIDAFLVLPSDAVALAGSEAVDVLGITCEKFLCVCAGAPVEASAVLEQLPADSMQGVCASTLLDTGLRKDAILRLGYTLPSLIRYTKASHLDLAKLGFGDVLGK